MSYTQIEIIYMCILSIIKIEEPMTKRPWVLTILTKNSQCDDSL